MANSVFNALNGGQQAGKRNLAPALLQHIQGFQGDPIQTIQAKLNSGEMTQAQYNQLHSAAQDVIQKMMGVLPRK